MGKIIKMAAQKVVQKVRKVNSKEIAERQRDAVLGNEVCWVGLAKAHLPGRMEQERALLSALYYLFDELLCDLRLENEPVWDTIKGIEIMMRVLFGDKAENVSTNWSINADHLLVRQLGAVAGYSDYVTGELLDEIDVNEKKVTG